MGPADTLASMIFGLIGFVAVLITLICIPIMLASAIKKIAEWWKKEDENDDSLKELLVYADKAIERKTAELEAVRKEWCSLDEPDRLYDVAMWAVEIGVVSVTDVQRQFSISHDSAKSYVYRLIELGVLVDDGSRNGKMVALMTEEGVKRLYNLGRM